MEHKSYTCDGCGNPIRHPWKLSDWVFREPWIMGEAKFTFGDDRVEAHLCNTCLKKAMTILADNAFARGEEPNSDGN